MPQMRRNLGALLEEVADLILATKAKTAPALTRHTFALLEKRAARLNAFGNYFSYHSYRHYQPEAIRPKD